MKFLPTLSFLLLIQIFQGSSLVAQQHVLQGPQLQLKSQREAKMNQAILNYAAPLADSYVLPVVFHIINQNPGSVTDQQILDALKNLNDAFARTGPYAVGSGVDTRIQFCLAQLDPDGGNTTGITRTTSFFTDVDQDLENGRLKNLVVWDPGRYINIWYITSIKSEIIAKFSCGQWTRITEGGYATMPPGFDSTDGIVVTGFGTLLAHELGHYLGLYHTFEGLDCSNANCATYGDRVCDTPPDGSIGNSLSCNQPQNSCSTDTLSGFAVDVPDLINNFMDYGNDACHNAFTEGQAVRMRAAIVTQRSGLLQNECAKPCAESIIAGFTRDNPYPLPGDLVSFSNTSTGASNYQWLINGTVFSTGTNFSYSFSSKGKFKITLRAYNADANCYATYTDYVIVTCGVEARFYPDKREIASKASIYLDSIYFTNRSVGATTYQWLMSNDAGMGEQLVGSGPDLQYVFQNPANYNVRLIANNATCADTTETFHFEVHDPTADGVVTLYSTKCFNDTKVKLSIYVCNSGYAPIPSNTPISFYENDPRNGNTNPIKLEPTFYLPDTVKGKCCGTIYQHILDVKHIGLNKLFAVFNDKGNSIPVRLPNGSLQESDYQNNTTGVTNFLYNVTATPPEATLLPGDTLQLTVKAGPGNTASYVWSTAHNLSCTTCIDPKLIADSSTIKKVVAKSEYGCTDSAFVVIKVPPADDFSLVIDSIRCEKNDSLYANFTICNSFSRGIIPAGLSVSFYDGNPSQPGAHLLGPVFVSTASNNDLCASFHHTIQGVPGGKIFAVVNDKGTSIPLNLPDDSSILEKDYTNNMAGIMYKRDSISLQPIDTAVLKEQPFSIVINTELQDPSSAIWSSGSGYTLSCYQCASPIITPFANAIVSMQVINPYGCTLRGQSKFRIFYGGKLNIPNVFTPNKDGHNDVFYVLGGKEVLMVRAFSVFNRWGEQIFQLKNAPPNDPGYGWDGRYKGKESEAGTYVYLIKIAFTDGSEGVYKGTITLIR
jgi:gliding motility-associated-like protein